MNKLSNFHPFSAKKKMLLLVSCSIFLFFVGFFFYFISQNTSTLFADMSYNRLCSDIFKKELSNNTLTLHYTLAEPANYGIYHYDAVLPVYSAENQALSNKTVTMWLEELAAIPEEELSENNKYGYGLLKRYLTLQSQFADYPYYDEPLSPNSGMQQTLPVLLSEYRFQKKSDIDDYLSLLSQMDDYYDGLLAYEQEKADAGFFMPESSVDALSTQCRSFFTEDSMKNGSHFLIDSFAERLMEFREQYPELLDDEEFEAYYHENLRILEEEIAPSYEKIADNMEQLAETYYHSQGNKLLQTGTGLGATPEGKAYYELLIRKSTGTYRPMAEIQEMLYQQFDLLHNELSQMTNQQAAFSENTELSVNEILDALQQDMKADFPALRSGSSQVSGKGIIQKYPPVSCDVKKISGSLSAYSAPAFYLTPPMDDYQKNVIYINPDSALKGASLFTTLAHEGFPGHLYQTVYAKESGIADKRNPLRGLLDYPGYCEGWALYVELASYDYAAKYYEINPDYQRTLRSLELCLCALLDFHIHYQGLTLPQTQALLLQFGIPAGPAEEIYSYIVQEPANYLKYYLSYLEILELKQTAKQLWAEDYSDLQFHKFYLDAGPSDFVALQDKLKRTANP